MLNRMHCSTVFTLSENWNVSFIWLSTESHVHPDLYSE